MIHYEQLDKNGRPPKPKPEIRCGKCSMKIIKGSVLQHWREKHREELRYDPRTRP